MATTSAEYIQHHLQNLTFGKLPAGYERADGSVVNESTWTFAKSGMKHPIWVSWRSTSIPWAGRF